MAKLTPSMSDTLAAIDAANAEIGDAVREGREADLMELVAAVEQLENQRNALLQTLVTARSPEPAYAHSVPLRVRVTSALHLVGRPMAVRLSADVAQARFGYSFDPRGIASLRRDELRSWRSSVENPDRAGAKPELIVPALNFDRFTPARGVLALSSWELPTRIVAPASGRVDVLHVACALSRHWLDAPQAPWAPSVERLIAQIGRSLMPFAGVKLWPTPEEVLGAASAELNLIEPPDRDERVAAASHAVARLHDERLLFGAIAMGSVPMARRVS